MSQAREIVFDVETTGLDPHQGDRITEIGCVELINELPTGAHFHCYCNPQIEISAEVEKLTGLNTAFLSGQPLFETQVQAFLDFVMDSPIIAHNAGFDSDFINTELHHAGYEPLAGHRFINTLQMARAKFPGQPASLDALCRRFGISLEHRQTHGALIDAELLAAVYLELKGGRMQKLDFNTTSDHKNKTLKPVTILPRPTPLSSLLSKEERAAHQDFINNLGTEMIWQKIWQKDLQP